MTLEFILILFGLSLVYKIFPPKKINVLYGYRTKRSMKNQDTWDVANRFCANIWLLLFGIALISALIFSYVLKSPEMTRYVGYTSLAGLILSIPITEIHIRRIFDKDGNRKNH